MIISVSRRTDIPAFYAGWFMQRIREQYCTTVNPFNRKQISHVSLRPDEVDAIVFWTKNVKPLIPHLHELDARGYRYYFQYTINGYGKIFEPRVPELDECIESFLTLSELVGSEKVIWRYDPIVLSNRTDFSYHQDRFHYILDCLHSATRRAVISFVDDYRKASVNFRRLLALGIELHGVEKGAELQKFCTAISQQARALEIPVFSCAESLDLAAYGILPGKCIDDTLIHELFGLRMKAEKDKSQRQGCRCVKSKDIGFYDTCLHGCAYCYAGTLESGTRNQARHEADSPSLVGRVRIP